MHEKSLWRFRMRTWFSPLLSMGRINSLCLHVYGDRKEGRTAFRYEIYKNIQHTVRYTNLTSKRFD